MAKRKIPYAKIAAGIKECFKGYERDCSECPYDKYNDHTDANLYGDAPDFCREHLVKDVKRWADELEYYTHCEDCAFWSKCGADQLYHSDWEKERRCTVWEQMTSAEEFCYRGARDD